MPEVQTRRGSVSAASDALTFESSLSSEEPVKRWGALEVLDHVPGAVDLARAKDGLPLLLNHDQNQLVGRVENVRLENRKLRGTLRFFETQAGQDARRLLQGGHREVSIGYHILEHRPERQGNADVIRVSRWAVLEASIVAVPADPSIGVQRSAQLSLSKGLPTMDTQIENGTAHDGASEPQLSRSQRRAASGSQQDELYRRDEILGYFKVFGKDGKVTIEDAQRAIAEGHSVDRFRQFVMDRIQTGHTDTRGFGTRGDVPLGLADPLEVERGYHRDSQAREWGGLVGDYSLSRAVLSQTDPAAYMRLAAREAEVSQELARRSAVKTQGMLVPMEALFGRQMNAAHQRALSVGTSTAGGNTVQSTIATELFADVLRSRTIAGTLGAQILTGLSDTMVIPRKTATATAAWLTETGAAGASDLATDTVTLSPKRIGAYTDVSRQLLIQSSMAMEQIVRKDLSDSILVELDRVAMFGTGASQQPRGVANTSGVGAVIGGTNGAQLTWAHILELERVVAAANGFTDMRTVGYALNPSTRSWLKRTLKVAGVGSDLIMGDVPVDELGLSGLNGYKAAVSTLVPSNGTKGTSSGVCSSLIFGDWSQVFIGQFGPGVELIVDAFSMAKTGQVSIVANLFADVGVRYGASFAVMADGLTV